MCKEDPRKDRIIFKMPQPFRREYTPYIQREFSESVITSCSSYSPATSYIRMCKVIILGDLGVGKTSLVNRFCHHVYNYNYKATIGVDFEMEKFHILKVPFNMQIWDTAGQERFKCIAGAYYRSAHAIVTAFDLRSISSLKHCVSWLKEALDCNTEEPLKFLVGTKKDLILDSLYESIEKEAGQMAELLGAEYWAVSSKSGWQVSELFQRIAALSFERLAESGSESFDKTNALQLGQTSEIKKKKNLRKRDIHCDSRLYFWYHQRKYCKCRICVVS